MSTDSTGDVTLIVRVWFEGDPPTELRARLVEVLENSPQRVVATVATTDDLQAAVRAWIDGIDAPVTAE